MAPSEERWIDCSGRSNRLAPSEERWIDSSGRSKWMAPDEDRLEGVRLVLEWVQLVERLRGMDGSTAVVGQNGWLWAMTAWREFDWSWNGFD